MATDDAKAGSVRGATMTRAWLTFLAVAAATALLAACPDIDNMDGLAPKPELVGVRVVYAYPSDKEARPDYVSGIRHVMASVRTWYAQQLGGPTFVMFGQVPQLCPLPRKHEWYATGHAWQKIEDDVRQHCVPVTLVSDPDWEIRDTGASDYVWVVMSDVVEIDCDHWHLGSAGRGMAMLHGLDLADFVTDGYLTSPCGVEGWDNDGGGLAHELAHGFGLRHPPGCDEGLPTCDYDALMAGGWWTYPDTYLRTEERRKLLASRFVWPRRNSENEKMEAWR